MRPAVPADRYSCLQSMIWRFLRPCGARRVLAKEYSMLNVNIPLVGNESSALPETLGLKRKDMDNGSITSG
jgi:hypothetical protein